MVGVVGVGLGLAACSGCNSPPEQAPANGTDAGAPEVMVADAARDVGYLETDLLPADQWAPIPGFPQECGERIALDPNTAVPKFDWKPCSGKWGPGCKRVDNTWSKWPYGAVSSFVTEPMRRTDRGVVLTYSRAEWQDNLHFTRGFTVVESATGERLVAVGVAPGKSGRSCSGRALAAEAHQTVIAASLGATEFLFLNPYDGKPRESHSIAAANLGVTANDADLLAVGARGHVYYATEPSTAIYDPSVRKVTIPKEMSGARIGAFPYVGAGEGALTLATIGSPNPTRAGYLGPEGTYSVLFDAQPKHFIAGMTLDRGVDPPQIVWIEARNDGAAASPTELWTSPFATSSAGISKRLVAKDAFSPGAGLSVVTADRGRAFFRNGLHSARLVRLVDGMGWNLVADPGEAFTEIAGLADDDAWLFVTQEDPKLQVLSDSTAILRVRVDDLGPPTVPRGF